MNIKSVADRTKQFVEKRIIEGEYHPGQQIKEEEIASRLEISRPPVREAFKFLEAEGLVTRKPRRGVFVAEITEKDVWEIYMLKIALYGLGISLAMDKMPPQGIRQLEQIVAAMEKCVGVIPANLVEYQTLNESFHNCLMDIAGNERLKKACSMLHNQVKRFSYKSLSDKGHLLSSLSSHRRMLEAIRNRDEALAERLNREHILEGMVVLQKAIGVEGGEKQSNG